MRRLLLAVATLVSLWAPNARAETIDAVLDSIQYTAFRYFWDEAHPVTGLVRDRSQVGSPCSVAAQGFGFSAICIAIDHGWITRAEGAARTLTALNTFWTLPQGNQTSGTNGYKGFFYHFLHMNDGLRQWEWGTELSTIDTALLLAGMLDAQVYFDGDDPTEALIRTRVDQINARVEWNWIVNPDNNAIRHGWHPENGGQFLIYDWIGYNEAMIVNILALGSPTFPVTPATWTAWTGGYNANWFAPQIGPGQTYTPAYLTFAPLFGHQYTHCWVDFRNKRDAFMQTKGSDYFENSRHATLAQQAYSVINFFAHPGYAANQWGITAGDGPPNFGGYRARGAPPTYNDDGTITPTATIGSLPFAPEAVLPTIQHLYDTYKSAVMTTSPCAGSTYWGKYGFRDGFNLRYSWWGCDWIGIDQGPMVLMIENYRNGAVWNRIARSSPIQIGLQRAGFVKVTGVGEPAPQGSLDFRAGPSPFASRATLRYALPRAGQVRLTVHDVTGREVARPVDAWQDAGEQVAHFDAGGLANGVYWYRLTVPGAVVERRGVLLR